MIPNHRLKRIANSLKQGMPFLADPPTAPGESYEGIQQFPGFHTTGSFQIAGAYAVGRVSTNMTFDEGDSAYVTDYPVVVQLDMSSFNPETDYDAEKVVKEPMEVHLQELISNYNLTVESSDEEIEEAVNEYVESSEGYENDPIDYSNPADVLFNLTFSQFHDPIPAISGDIGFPDLVREFISTGEINPEFLMKATDQYRYTQDIDENHITAVYYLQPIASDLLSYDNEDQAEELETKWQGFDLNHEDDLRGSFEYQFTSTLVYGQDGQGEFHGTTYKRLLQAAPNLANQLPQPPSPPYQG